MGKRAKAIYALEKLFLQEFVENKVSGTDFDKEVLKCLDKLREQYAVDPEDEDKPQDLQE